MQTSLRTDQIMSDLTTQIGNYKIDKVQRVSFDNSMIDVGAFQAVKHIRENYVDDETELFGLNKVLNKKDPYGYSQHGLQGNDRGSFIQKKMDALPESVVSKKNKSSGSVNRFEFLPNNPQTINHIIMHEPHRGGFHTRNFEKDSYANKC